MSIFISLYTLGIAQQPLLKFKPNPLDVDSMDVLLGFGPIKLISSKLNLGTEFRIYKNITFKIESSLKIRKNLFFTEIRNLEITNQSILERYNEQSCNFIIKRYRKNKNAKVYFGPYLGVGLNLMRTNIKMSSQVDGFDPVTFDFRTTRKSYVVAIGTTKLFGKNVVFDYSIQLKYLYKTNQIGSFSISSREYKTGWKSSFVVGIYFPLNRK